MRTFVVIVLSGTLGAGPTIVGSGVISTERVERGSVIDPTDGSLYFVRADQPWGEQGCGRILRSRFEAGSWREPELVMGGDGCYGDPFISRDGRALYFTSHRLDDGMRRDQDLWTAVRSPQGEWVDARPIDALNTDGYEASPVLADDGTLYFASTRAGGLGQGDLWRAEPTGDGFGSPIWLGPRINTPHGEWNLLIAPDESWIILEASGRPEGLSASGDLYISWSMPDGWGEPLPLAALNTTGSDLLPRLTIAGDSLLYTSTRVRGSRNADLFSIPLHEALAGIERPSR